MTLIADNAIHHVVNAPPKIVASADLAVTTPVRYRLRVADYLLLHEQGSFSREETELVDGQVYVMSPEWRPHFRIKSELMHRLHAAVRAAGLPYFVGSEGSVALSDADMPRPDVTLTSEAEGEGPIPVASVPLAVEVACTSLETDLEEKAGRYADGGLAEYWVVDVYGRLVHCFSSPAPGGYRQHDEVKFGKPLTSATMPTLTISTEGL